MSAVPELLVGEVALERRPEPRPGGLPTPARIYIAALAALTFVVAGPYYILATRKESGWTTFAVLAVAAAVTQVFPVKAPRNMMYHTSVVFLVAAALLLPPELIVLVPLVQTIPETLKERYPWPIQCFNIANYTLNAMAAWGAAHLLRVYGAGPITDPDLRFAVAGLAACIAFVASNHVFVAIILKLGRGHSFRETGLFSVESVSIDLVLTILGVALVAFWRLNPWLVFAALAPLVVVHRSLSVPQLQAEARIDAKTGLFNARYFSAALAAELSRSARFERPLSLIMADLDLLRDINNSYGHLAGDAVLCGVANVFRSELRQYDVASRFGGEEFSILLPEASEDEAHEIAERIRRAVADWRVEVDTAAEPIGATLSIGVASFPADALDPTELIHQADLAVYRAKLQGRNRVVRASAEPLTLPAGRAQHVRLAPLPPDSAEPEETDAEDPQVRQAVPQMLLAPTRIRLRGRLAWVVATVTVVGIAAGLLGLVLGRSTDALGLVAVVALVGVGQALSFELAEGSISVSAVGSLAGAALFDYRAALPLAVTSALVDWSARRNSLHHVAFNIGTLTLSSLGAAAIFTIWSSDGTTGRLAITALGVAAGGAYFLANTSLVSLSSALEGDERPLSVFQERYAWLAPHYLVYGFIAAVIGIAYDAVGLYALAVFVVPLLLMRMTQAAYLRHTQRATRKLREASDTIRAQNVSLEQANRLLRERSTAAMESLSATVDARDAYTAGHSRRVQQLALAIGCELGLSQGELDLLDHAALFHDIGKLAVPDAILLKPGSLEPDEWETMQRHAAEGARIIERLGFLHDAVPSIRHHHERWDGGGYPDRLRGEEIPLGARIIHVADALDSMLTTRIYRAARPLEDALAEIRRSAGTQFCPRCTSALDRVIALDAQIGGSSQLPAAS
jgi:diguanylate cyclase (GGDEF)-like protein/putative nucleotidyltransferase with HDIG domain